MPLADGVSFVAASSGTGTFVFGSSRSSYLTLAQGVSDGELVNGQVVSYVAVDNPYSPTQREWGHGVFSSSGSGSITRAVILGGTAGPSVAVNFSVAPSVFLTVLAEDLPPPPVSVAITSAQILGLAGTPVPIIPAPGSGLTILIQSVCYHLTFGTTPYAGGGGGLFYGGNSSAAADSGDQSVPTVSASSRAFAFSSEITLADSLTANQGVSYCNFGTAYTAGDGTEEITVSYTIV
jgi:hypothetical protein